MKINEKLNNDRNYVCVQLSNERNDLNGFSTSLSTDKQSSI